ncbi:MAG: hypothetical protein ACHREM_06060 [Polyangiales bacterium]
MPYAISTLHTATFRQLAAATALLASATFTLGARADAPVASIEPRHRIAIDDGDPHAVYELRDQSNRLVDRCLYPCSLSAPRGEYSVIAVHGGSRDAVDVDLTSDAHVHGRSSSYVGVAVGVPVVLVSTAVSLIGAFVAAGGFGGCLGDCTPAEEQTARAQADQARPTGYAVLGLGLAGIFGGIVLISSSHGSSLEVVEHTSPIRSLSVTAAPAPGGGGVALTGRF